MRNHLNSRELRTGTEWNPVTRVSCALRQGSGARQHARAFSKGRAYVALVFTASSLPG